MAAPNEATATKTPKSIRVVAEPRDQPRAASRLTAGSIARAKNSEIKSNIKKFVN